MQSTFRHNTSAAAAAEWAQDGIYRNRTTSGARLALSSVAGTRHYDLWYCRAVACVSLSSLPFFWNTDLFFVIFLSPLVILFPLVLLIEISANVAVCASAFASSEDVCSAWLLNFRRLLLLFFGGCHQRFLRSTRGDRVPMTWPVIKFVLHFTFFSLLSTSSTTTSALANILMGLIIWGPCTHNFVHFALQHKK